MLLLIQGWPTSWEKCSMFWAEQSWEIKTKKIKYRRTAGEKGQLQEQTFSKREPRRRDGSRMKLCGGERSVREEKSKSLIAFIWRGWWTDQATSPLTRAHCPRTQLPDSQLSPQKKEKKRTTRDWSRRVDAVFCCFYPNLMSTAFVKGSFRGDSCRRKG